MSRIRCALNFNINWGTGSKMKIHSITHKYIFPVWVCLWGLVSSCGGQRRDDISDVDMALERVEEAQAEALRKADSTASIDRLQTDPHTFTLRLIAASDAYNNLDLEKSLQYLNIAYQKAKESEEATDSLRVLLKMASIYNAEGLMLKEASEIFNSIDKEKLPEDLKLSYYILGVQINKNLTDRSMNQRLREIYSRQASEYRDSVLSLDPGSYIIASNRLIENGDISGALEMVLRHRPNDSGQERTGPFYHHLANIYRLAEKPDSQKFYLAKAAADDLRNGVREYKALTELAELLEDEDVNKAYSYISQSYSDAILSHSSLRQREVAPIYSQISTAYRQRQRHITATIFLISVSLFVLLISIAGALAILRKKNKELAKQRNELKKSRDELDKLNVALEESNSLLNRESMVKSKYIHSFMELCLSYLAKMERFRERLGKIASGGDLAKVVKAINSGRYVNEEISEFYSSFDSAFFSLYPEFIDMLNGLLQPEYAYEKTTHLSTELRIYALVWLGVDSSGEIAKFLRCAESTVYNYRTQMRNKAKDRDRFEEEFRQLSRQKPA